MTTDIQYIPDWNGKIEVESGVVAFRWNDGVLEFCRIVDVWENREQRRSYRWSAIPQKGDETLSGFE